VFKTLYGKLSAVLLLLFCCIGILFVLLTLFTTRVHLQEMTQKLNRSLALHIASANPLIQGGLVREGAVREIFHMLMAVHPGIEVYLLDKEGRILTYSAPPGKVKRERVSLVPLETFLAGEEAFPILGDDPRNPRGRKVFSVAPVPAGGPVEGYLYIILGGEEYDTVSRMLQGSYIVQLSIWVAGGGVLFALMTGLLLFYRITYRHRRLAKAVVEFQESGFSIAPDVLRGLDAGKGDEIGQLGTAFTKMADRIVQQIRDLRQSDHLRRELVTHVSHDLRTPLTSLQGYLETLSMKKGELSTGEQEEYLRVALLHCRRLSTLVSELFELSMLDSPDVVIRHERFSLGDLVQDVLQKFRLAAEEKKVHLSVRIGEGIPFAVGDIALMERVLENLIGNALRHTPDNGRITIEAEKTDSGLAVRVSDTGSGIPPEQLSRLFDPIPGRFGDPGKDGEGAGLGLVIARRILELHGSDITVQSVVNEGSTFAFHLRGTDSARPSP
jgi:two-component system OmpR family sensor kinase